MAEPSFSARGAQRLVAALVGQLGRAGQVRRIWRLGWVALLGLPCATAWAQAPSATSESSVRTVVAPAPALCPPVPDDGVPAEGADRGLLWRVQRGGHTSYLFGTMHVGRAGWRQWGPRSAAALAASDTVALELDLSDPGVVATLVQTQPLPPLPAPLQERLAAALARLCLPATALDSLHPMMQATTLTLMEARWLGLDPALAVDLLLAEHARARGLKLVSLETAREQQALLTPASPAETERGVDQALAQIENGTVRRVLARMAANWEQGELTELERYAQWCECANTAEERRFLQRLNDARNPALAEGIAALHRRGRRVFAAVGVLHMIGPKALPALLRAKGFKVERVVFARPG